MKKTIISNFYIQEKYGTRRHVVRLYLDSGNYFVTFKYTSMRAFDTKSYGDDLSAARLSYIQKVLFLLS